MEAAMPVSDDLDVIRALLTGEPPSPQVSHYVKGRLTDVIAAHTCPGDGRPAPRGPRWRRTGGGAGQRRRLALRVAGGVAAVLAASAVAVAAAVVPGVPDHGTVRAVTTADVVRRVDNALSAAGPGTIAQLSVTTRTGPPSGKAATATATEWSYGDRWRSVTDSPSGQPAYDQGLGPGSGYTLVSYPAQAWARYHEPGRPATHVLGPPGCPPAAATVPLLFHTDLPAPGLAAGSLPTAVARDLRAAISCGSLAVAGRQRVNGAEAIKLASGPASPIAETVWVSPGSYLPVRVVTRSAFGGHVVRQAADIAWLAPTAQNLAKLTVPIPAAFHRVPLGPLLHHIPGERARKVTTAP
jgi:hypothetical protein